MKTITVYINDSRVPGGSYLEIERNYEVHVTPYHDGTFSVTGLESKVRDYLEDYSMSHLFEEHDIVTPQIGYEK